MNRTLTIQPNSHFRVRMFVDRTQSFQINVFSERAVTTYFLDEIGLATFYAGENVRSLAYGGESRRRDHSFTVKMKRGEVGYLLVVNYGEEPTAVHVSSPV